MSAVRRAAGSLRALTSLPHAVRVLARGVALVFRCSPPTAALYLASATLKPILAIAQVWLVKQIVDSLVAAASAPGAPGISAPLAYAAAYAASLALSGALVPIEESTTARFRDLSLAEMDRRLMRAAERLPDLTHIEAPAFLGRLRFVRNAIYAPGRLLYTVRTVLSLLLTLAGLLPLLAQLHPLLPVVLLVGGLPEILVSTHINRLTYAAIGRRTDSVRMADYCARLVADAGAAKEVRVYGLADFFLRRFRSRRDAAVAEQAAITLEQLRLRAGIAAVDTLVLAGGFLYVASQVAAGRLTLGDLTLFLAALQQTQRSIQGSLYRLGGLHDLYLQLNGYFSFLDSARPGIALAAPATALPAPTAIQAGIRLERVSFTYPAAQAAVLDDVDLVLPAGTVTAIVGANGAGKSTLVKLLCRFYDPTAGAITLDGHPLPAYDLDSLRSRTAAAYQDFARFSLTLGQNVSVDAPPDRIRAAARQAGVDEIAARLPLGYDTPLTRHFEGGTELSGGEWQKVALARAFVGDAQLVILDEPTAALDADAEHHLFERFRTLVRGKTGLLISHRFSTVRMADHIVVLEHGKIVERGTHDDLVAGNGRYAALYEMQAGRYR